MPRTYLFIHHLLHGLVPTQELLNFKLHFVEYRLKCMYIFSMVLILFSIFYSSLFFFTQGFNKIFNLFQNMQYEKENEIDSIVLIKIFYPIIGIFYIGNIIFILNFITGIKRLVPYLLIIIFCVVIYGVINTDLLRNKLYLIMNLLVPAIIGISSYGIGIHYDAGLYSIPNQVWIRESSIVFGLTNINPWLSWMSLFEYFSTLLWFNNSFTFLHFLDNSFIVTIFIFIFFGLKSKNIFYQSVSFSLVLFSLLDNVGYLGGANGFPMIEKVLKPNNSVAILIFITTFLIILCIKNKIYSKESLQIISLFSLFSYQLSGIGIIIIFPSIFYLSKYLINKKESRYSFFKQNIFTFIIFLFWLIKNIFNSACFFFPIVNTCIKSLSWFNDELTQDIEKAAFNRGYNYDFNEPFLDYFSRAINYSNTKQILINFVITFLILFLINKILYSQKYNLEISVLFSVFYIICCIYWLRVGAIPRYGMYLFILPTIFITLNNTKQKYKSFKTSILFALFFIALALTPRIYSYYSFLEYDAKLYYVYEPNVMYEKIKDEWGYYPINEDLIGQIGSDRCYSNINCRPRPIGEYKGSKNLIRKEIGRYSLFVVENN